MTPTTWLIILRSIVLGLRLIVGPIVLGLMRELVAKAEAEQAGAPGTDKKKAVMDALKEQVAANEAIKQAPGYIYSMGVDIVLAELRLK